MKFIINPKYKHLSDYMRHIDEHFEREGVEIHRGRNVIKVLEVEGLTLCVKHYGSLPLRRRLADRTYRTPKGKKAYVRPLQLRERGFESPEPVAYVAYHRSLTRDSAYFVCLLSNYTHSMAEACSLPQPERDELTRNFAEYAARLHEGGFLHRDFSSDNILYGKVNGKYHFSLIDTNSMRGGKRVGVEKGCKNLARLQGDDHFFGVLLDHYAACRKSDPEQCRKYFERAYRPA